MIDVAKQYQSLRKAFDDSPTSVECSRNTLKLITETATAKSLSEMPSHNFLYCGIQIIESAILPDNAVVFRYFDGKTKFFILEDDSK